MNGVTEILTGRTAGLELYDSQARFYDPVLGRTTTVDPKSAAYAGTSHYAWCTGNPVRFVDPDGRRLWSVDENGYINLISETEYKDKERFELTVSNEKNKENSSRNDESGDTVAESCTDTQEDTPYIELEEGAVLNFRKVKDGKFQYDILNIRGDGAAKSLFEFMSSHVGKLSKVEFSITQTGVRGDKGLNFISTSHEVQQDRSMSWLFATQLLFGYTLNTTTHSHPCGSPASEEDKKFKRKNTERLQKAGYKVPVFQIFNVKTNATNWY